MLEDAAHQHVVLEVVPGLRHVLEHAERFPVAAALQQEAGHAEHWLGKGVLAQERMGKENDATKLVEGCRKFAARGEKAEEAEKVLQVGTADEGWRALLLDGHLAAHGHGRGLALLNHLQHVLRQAVEHEVESQHK